MSKEQSKHPEQADGAQGDACDWLESLEGDAWADACEAIAASVQRQRQRQHVDDAKVERKAFEAHESKERRLSPEDQRFWFRRGAVADYDCKAIDDAWKAWRARAAIEHGSHASLRGALEQALMALIGYLPAHRNAVTDAAIEAARAALAQPSPIYANGALSRISRMAADAECQEMPCSASQRALADIGRVADAALAQPSQAIPTAPTYQFQWREIGESDWDPCDFSWYLYCQKSPEHDTRVVEVATQPSPAPELDPLGLAPHAANFNEAPSEALRPELERPNDDLTPPEFLAGKLIEAWVEAHGKKIPWDKAIHISAIITKMPDEERDRLLAMSDDPVAHAGQVPEGYMVLQTASLSHVLGLVEGAMEDAYGNAFQVCCGKGRGGECCGDPEAGWSPEDQRTMDVLNPIQRELRAMLAAAPAQGE